MRMVLTPTRSARCFEPRVGRARYAVEVALDPALQAAPADHLSKGGTGRDADAVPASLQLLSGGEHGCSRGGRSR